jgi:RimJ/RimL family protein N-acetyltransferase
MWLCGFVPMARHYGFYDDGALVGFCCINDDGHLLQFFVDALHVDKSAELFASIVAGHQPPGKVYGAFVSTAEPWYLSHCLDHFSKFTVNAHMYQLHARRSPWKDRAPDADRAIVHITSSQLVHAVQLAVDSIGAPEEWLQGYYSNLIDREELFGLWNDGQLVATGERRRNDALQTEYADVGVIVAPSARGQGLATDILKQLVAMNEAKQLKSICSTEASNLAAQKSITRAGFTASHRIIQFQAGH